MSECLSPAMMDRLDRLEREVRRWKRLGTATEVSLTDALPSGISLLSATQGSCTETGGVVTCSLGRLAEGTAATVRLVVTATSARAIGNTASVWGSEPDPLPTTNRATAVITVLPSCLGTGQAQLSGRITTRGERDGIPEVELTLHGLNGCVTLAVTDAAAARLCWRRLTTPPAWRPSKSSPRALPPALAYYPRPR